MAFGQAHILLSHTLTLGEKVMKSTVVCILIDRLMVPLYQTNSHNNSVRKNVRSLAIMGMLLGLFHKFGFDLLSPGNLAECVSAISK
jgi:hypothetical protein